MSLVFLLKCMFGYAELEFVLVLKAATLALVLRIAADY